MKRQAHPALRVTFALFCSLVFWAPSSLALALADESNLNTAASFRQSNEDASSRLFNFRVNPIGLLYEVFGGEADVRVAKRMALGFSGQVMSASSVGTQTTIMQFGLVSTHYLSGRGFDDGWVLRPGIYYVPTTSEARRTGQTILTKTSALAAFGGYEWVFRRGFNIETGAGLSLYRPKGIGTGLQPLLELHLGWMI